jgi:hypothetical protein
MRRSDMQTLQDATTKAFGAQIERTLAVMRIRGFDFPDHSEVGVTIKAATALVTQVQTRMDDIHVEGNITPENAVADVDKISDALVVLWLDKYAIKWPA